LITETSDVAATTDAPTETILGIRFFDGSAREAVEELIRRGGYVVVPAAPALVNIRHDEDYRRALLEADMAIADSGFMVLLWRAIRRRRVNRVSGLRYLQLLLEQQSLRESDAMFVVLPTEPAKARATAWLQSRGFQVRRENLYVAPIYGRDATDQRLRDIVEAARPKHIIVALGGGTQERLGHYLRDHLSYRPAIHCVGAALGFLTGDQRRIPDWADRLYLGWFLRLTNQPRLYLHRYWAAHELPWMIWKYGSELPPLVAPRRR
jgi:exopolysaccharide biosynthesis WecB/TagA/CpsF family protein